MKWLKLNLANSAAGRSDWGHRRWRRWRRWVWVGIGVVAVLFLLSWAVRARMFTVQRVYVMQQVNVKPDVIPTNDIQAYANRQVGTWLWLDRTSFQQSLLKKYPSLRQAAAITHFPDTLDVEVLPRVPLCQLVTPSGAYVVDRSGFVFARLNSVDSKLPQMKTNREPSIGSKVSSSGLTLGLRLITGLRSSQPALQGIDLHDGQLDIILNGPPLIMVSENAQAEIVLKQIIALMGKFNGEHRYPQQLDMRFERPVIRY